MDFALKRYPCSTKYHTMNAYLYLTKYHAMNTWGMEL